MSSPLHPVDMEDWLSENHVRRFSHQAMATIFQVFLVSDDPVYAEQAAHEAFLELDRLEQELSRFIPNSDISRINNLKQGESLIINPATLACLEACQQVHSETGGKFDIAAGSLIHLWRSQNDYSPEEFEIKRQELSNNTNLENLEILADKHQVILHGAHINIDLGGYGKGYALDCMAELLRDWDMTRCLIHGGQSSVLAMDAPTTSGGWPLSISHPQFPEISLMQPNLQNKAISGSGMQKGAHIIDPVSGQPVADKIAAWNQSDTAALGDALSTAFMLMSLEDISDYVANHPDIAACVLLPAINSEKSFHLEWFGKWDKYDSLSSI